MPYATLDCIAKQCCGKTADGDELKSGDQPVESLLYARYFSIALPAVKGVPEPSVPVAVFFASGSESKSGERLALLAGSYFLGYHRGADCYCQ